MEAGDNNQVGDPAGGDVENGAAAQSADIERLSRLIDDEPGKVEGEQLETDTIEAAGVKPNAEENLSGLLELMATPLDELGYKKTALVWSPETCRKVAEKMVPVLNKTSFGRRFLAWLEDGFGIEELALLALLSSLYKKTKAAVLEDIAAMQEASAKAGDAN